MNFEWIAKINCYSFWIIIFCSNKGKVIVNNAFSTGGYWLKRMRLWKRSKNWPTTVLETLLQRKPLKIFMVKLVSNIYYMKLSLSKEMIMRLDSSNYIEILVIITRFSKIIKNAFTETKRQNLVPFSLSIMNCFIHNFILLKIISLRIHNVRPLSKKCHKFSQIPFKILEIFTSNTNKLILK